MLTKEALGKVLLSKEGAWLDYPFGEHVAVYKVGKAEGAKMFALVDEKATPARISLKCDPQLAEVLRERYESVLPGYHLNKRHWNTVILSGQLSEQEVLDLIEHSYQLVAGVLGTGTEPVA
jgi:predicted DNA-binding protein (MmcQ/YjbR family)